MAFLLILLLLFGFVLGGVGSGSSSSLSGSGSTVRKPVIKCSKHMAAKAPGVQERRCGPPPAHR
jgi:hypothetical protein